MDTSQLRAEIIETFTPGTPISETDLFVGRQATIRKLQDIALEPGRHAIIYGERGVGKTSLANIFYRPMNSETRSVFAIRVNCDKADTYDSLWRKIFRRIKRTENGEDSWASEAHVGPLTPDDVQVELADFTPNTIPIIIIDEYDRVTNDQCRVLITDTIKGLSDGLVEGMVRCTIVIVGVAESVTQLVFDHASISRALVQVPMKRMSSAELADIVVTRMKRLRMSISDDALWRIGFFSAGLPFYAHSLGKHAALRAADAGRRKVTESDVLDALMDCMEDVDYSARESYVRATERIYRKANIFAQVLAACALTEPNDLGQFSATSMEPILSELLGKPVKSSSFAFHLNEMCGPERGSVLRKTGERRTYLYHFGEPVMQPYILMKSITDGILSKAQFEKFFVQRQARLSI